MFFPGSHFETTNQLCENGRFAMIGRRKAKIPHREHRKAITKSSSQSNFVTKQSNRYARHHCIAHIFLPVMKSTSLEKDLHSTIDTQITSAYNQMVGQTLHLVKGGPVL